MIKIAAMFILAIAALAVLIGCGTTAAPTPVPTVAPSESPPAPARRSSSRELCGAWIAELRSVNSLIREGEIDRETYLDHWRASMLHGDVRSEERENALDYCEVPDALRLP